MYLSHEIGDRGRLSKKDSNSIKNSLVLNGLIPVYDEPTKELFYTSYRGWDDQEADELHPDNQD